AEVYVAPRRCALPALPLNSTGRTTATGLPVGLDAACLAAAGKTSLPKPVSECLVFDQGLLQVLQASVTGLEPKQSYVLALSRAPDGGGALEPLAAFTTNPAGAAIVNALGP